MGFDGDGTKLIPGPCEIIINGVQLGHTEENVTLEWGDSIKRHHSHEAGEVPVKYTQLPRPVTMRVQALEITKEVSTLAFPEASVTTTGLVSVNQDNLTELAAVEVTIHPTIEGANATKDIVLKQMVGVGPPINTGWGAEDKLKLDLVYERQWKDTGLSYTVGGDIDPA